MNSKFHKILVLGNTGYGKSTLCNYILSYDKKIFKESDKTESCTFEVNGYPANENSKNKGIYMIDTPGLNDGKGRDQEIIDKIREELKKKHCQGIKSIIIVENVTIMRISNEAQRQLSIYCRLFKNPEFWLHVGIVFSNSSSFWPDQYLKIVMKKKQEVYIPSVIKFVKDEIEKIGKDYKIPNVFQMFFTDCGEILPPATHKRTDEEIDRLISWTRGQDYIDFDPNDFNAVFPDYKETVFIRDQKFIPDLSSLSEKEKNEINNKIKEKNKDKDYMKNIEKEDIKKQIIEYRKVLKVKDFYNKEDVITEKKVYKTETFYIKTVTYYKNEKIKEGALDENKLDKKTYKSKELWYAIIKYKDTGEEIEIHEEIINKNMVDPDSIIITKSQFKVVQELTEFKDDPYYILQQIHEIGESESWVQRYFEERNRVFNGKKILIYLFDFATFFAVPFISLIRDWFKGVKPQWVIRGRKIGYVRLKKEKEKNDLGAIRERDWELDHIYKEWYEYEKPYPI